MLRNKRIIGVAISLIAVVAISITAFVVLTQRKEKNLFLELTQEQKIEDFEYFYNTMKTSYPMLDADKSVMGLDFLSKKDYYLQLVKSTKTDFEFYTVMSAIGGGEFQSFHTDLVFPSFGAYENMGCYNVEKTIKTSGLKKKTQYWIDTIEKETKKNSNDNIIFTYKDGKYVYDNYLSDNTETKFESYDEVLTINNLSPEEFYKSRVSGWDWRYDHKRETAYKTRILLNESQSDGEEVELSIKKANGQTYKQKLYYSLIKESFWLNEMNGAPPSKEKEDSNNFFHSPDKSFSYIKFDDLNSEKSGYLKEHLVTAKGSENIIIDIRGNYGGTSRFIQDNIYSVLFGKDIVSNIEWYMPKSESNGRIKRELTGLFKKHKFEELSVSKFTDSLDRCYYKVNSKFTYRGSQIPYTGQIYLLTDNRSGSAADGLANLVKNNKLGILIGTNTHGEGTAGSFMMDSLPNSKLVFVYMPSLSYNSDGTVNSLYGTPPDQYIEQSIESFYKQSEARSKGEDENTFENKLIWDNVLQDTVEIIKKAG